MPIEPATPTVARSRGSRIIAVAVLVGAAALAVATTEGRVAVPPSAVGLAGLALAIAVLVGLAVWPSGRGTSLAVAAALVGLGLVGAQDYLRSGLTMGHDTHHHLWGLWAVWRSVLDGDWTPRWIPYLGTGMPLLQFYSPLAFILAAPAQAAGASAAVALKWLMALAQVASAASAYGAAKWLGAGRAGGLVAAVATVIAPYHLLDQTVRCALAESLAFPVLPLFLAAGWKVLAGEAGRATRVLASAAPVLLLIHPLSLITGGIALVLLAPFAFRGRPAPWRRLGRLVAAGVLGAGLSAGWWLPIYFDLPHTGVLAMTAASRSLAEESTGVLEPIERRWSLAADPGAEMPLYFGCVWVALLVLAAGRPRAPDPGGSGCVDPRPWGIVGLFLLLLSCRPLVAFLALLPGIEILRYPWRLYAPATVIAALGGGLALASWLRAGAYRPATRPPATRPLARAAAVALLLGLMAFDAAPYLGSPGRVPDYRGMVRRQGLELLPVALPRDRFLRVEEAWLPPADYDWNLGKTRRVFAEYLPAQLFRGYGCHWHLPESHRDLSEILHVSHRFTPGGEPLELSPLPYALLRPDDVEGARSPIALDWQRVPERIRVALPADHPPGVVRVAESLLPGWQVRLDDGPWGEPLGTGSLLATAVPESTREVSFRYAFARPWYRAAGYCLSLLSLLCWLLPPVRERLLG